jgi:hypothetical protein
MKKILIILVIGLISYSCIAQNKITRYCEIENWMIRGKTNIKLTRSEVDSLFSFRDSTVKIKLENVSNFHTVPDALNYMGYLGWTLLSATITPSGFKTFYFKKEFDPSEISK